MTEPDPNEGGGWGSWLSAIVAPLVLSALAFALAYGALEPRGTHTWGLWMVEAMERVRPWLGSDGMWTAQAIETAWAGHSALPPFTIAASTITGAIWPDLGPMGAAHLISVLAFALTVPLVWGLGRRAGGPPGAAAAALAFATTPRMVGAGTAVGFDAVAVLGVTLAIYALYRARTSALWTGVAALALAVAALTTHVGVLLLAPWLLLTLGDKGQISTMLMERGRDPEAPEGFLRSATFPPGLC